MLIRSKLISRLYLELIGPLNGIEEKLHENPYRFYTMGILVPPNYKDLNTWKAEDINSNDLLENQSDVDDDYIYEDARPDEDVKAVEFGEEISPNKPLSTFGMMFTVADDRLSKDSQITLYILVTWGEYKKDKKEKVWRRSQKVKFMKLSLRNLIEKKQHSDLVDDKFTIIINHKKEGNHHHQISISLVMKKLEKGKIKNKEIEEYCIFQPEIRVLIKGGRLVREHEKRFISKSRGKLSDADTIDYVYSRLGYLVKGKMCNVYWTTNYDEWFNECPLDPQYYEEELRAPPFIWLEKEFIIRQLKEKNKRTDEIEMFTPRRVVQEPKDSKVSLLRTTFLPIFVVPTANYDWVGSGSSSAPLLDAEELSEMWEPEELKNSLWPLYKEYKNWIEEYKEKYLKNEENERSYELLSIIFNNLEEAAERIRKGIELLVRDEDARLAFCFMNKAVYLQHKWKKRSGKFSWRPYQLAYILLNIESIVDPSSKYREVCDLLWVPTGGGKTEAYLGLIAFTLAYRRRRALKTTDETKDRSGAGVAVISRYTLRLLTIQQFRRATRLITACEYLRTYGFKHSNSAVGWRPKKYHDQETDFIWGLSRFSIGLWVGGRLAPNKLKDVPKREPTNIGKPKGSKELIRGALNLLKEGESNTEWGEPAQLIECPVCSSLLIIPKDTKWDEIHEAKIYIPIKSVLKKDELEKRLREARDKIIKNLSKYKNIITLLDEIDMFIEEFPFTFQEEPHVRFYSWVLQARKGDKTIDVDAIKNLFEELQKRISNKNNILFESASANVTRPGYYIISRSVYKEEGAGGHDFEVFCPNPKCELNDLLWTEGYPSSPGNGDISEIRHPYNKQGRRLQSPDGLKFFAAPREFTIYPNPNVEYVPILVRMPIPIQTVDEQIYRRPPSFVIATVDKFAQLPLNEDCSSLFGLVNYFSSYLSRGRDRNQKEFGYHRDISGKSMKGRGYKEYKEIPPLHPPELIIQDELHLINGPLGSMVGLYEIAVDFLCSRAKEKERVKYISSTATIREGEALVRNLFARKLKTFPPLSPNPYDRFFIRFENTSIVDENRHGRAYVGVMAPGRSMLYTTSRVWSALLQTTHEIREREKAEEPVKYYWTLVGYFNKLKNLAKVSSLYDSTISEMVSDIARRNNVEARNLDINRKVELSSRVNSVELPFILKRLDRDFAYDALLTTSMFGTGVDIPNLSLMVMHEYPVTTGAYIQATGRIGRKRGGLVVTIFSIAKPRDISLYEFFLRHHLAIDRHVEKPNISPLSAASSDKILGPVIVAMIRHYPRFNVKWIKNDAAIEIEKIRNSKEIKEVMKFIIQRSPRGNRLKTLVESVLDKWKHTAAILSKNNQDLVYYEYFTTDHNVVLGTPYHRLNNKKVVFSVTPTSMRDIEPITSIKGG